MSEPEEIEETLQEFSLVCQRDIVFCDGGDDVVLLCCLQPAISAASMEIKWQFRADLICHYKDGEVTVIEDYKDKLNISLQDLQNGNVSLTLRDVRASQRGVYICEVTYKWLTKKEFIFLHVSSENFRLVGPSDTISAESGAEVILPVHLTPETNAVNMKIKWLKGKELIYEYKYGQGTAKAPFENRVDLSIQQLETGKLSLTLRNVHQSDSGDYTCMVFHDGSVTTAIVHLQVTDIKADLKEERSQMLERLQKLEDEIIKNTENLLNETLNDKIKLVRETLDYIGKKKKTNVRDESTRETDMEEERENRRSFSLHGRRSRSLEDRPQHSLTRRFNRSSVEAIPPLMGDESTLERNRMEEEGQKEFTFSSFGSTRRLLRNSVEAIPPLMRDDSTLERDSMEAAEILYSMENSPTTRHRSSMEALPPLAATQQQENPGETMQRSQELTQEGHFIEQDIPSLGMPLEEPPEEGTPESVSSSPPAAAAETQTQDTAEASSQRRYQNEAKCQIM